jgi:hypothetical protein
MLDRSGKDNPFDPTLCIPIAVLAFWMPSSSR